MISFNGDGMNKIGGSGCTGDQIYFLSAEFELEKVCYWQEIHNKMCLSILTFKTAHIGDAATYLGCPDMVVTRPE